MIILLLMAMFAGLEFFVAAKSGSDPVFHAAPPILTSSARKVLRYQK